MILYLLRFSLALALIYGFYRVFLENGKGHVFNRMYLLAGLFFALLVPTLSVGGLTDVKVIIGQTQPTLEQATDQWEMWIMYAYFLVTAVFLIRLLRDLLSLRATIKNSTKEWVNHTPIILTNESSSPYSFLTYVFVHRDQFDKLEPELLKHEIAHVNQWHTLDIFIIELFRVILWFNPIITWYKRSMQLNHEFLADEHVLRSHQNVSKYQQILLQYLGHEEVTGMASGFNFSLTKKRLLMMSKNKTRIQLLHQLLVVPLVVLVIWSCSDNKGVSGKEMLQYWRYTASMEEILQTGMMNEKDLQEGVILPIENKQQYDELTDIYNRMNQTQKESVYPLPPYLEPIQN